MNRSRWWFPAPCPKTARARSRYRPWWFRHSCEKFLRLGERGGQNVHLVLGIIHRKRRPARGGKAVAGEQRHHTMGAGAHRYALAVDDGRDIVRMRTFKLER